MWTVLLNVTALLVSLIEQPISKQLFDQNTTKLLYTSEATISKLLRSIYSR